MLTYGIGTNLQKKIIHIFQIKRKWCKKSDVKIVVDGKFGFS